MIGDALPSEKLDALDADKLFDVAMLTLCVRKQELEASVEVLAATMDDLELADALPPPPPASSPAAAIARSPPLPRDCKGIFCHAMHVIAANEQQKKRVAVGAATLPNLQGLAAWRRRQ
ncbi:hypothetical protein TSOC_007012 [Tetrabaena socialis]|uniref:Uncharacterized protein n=1 Tax=Tetrabaena socialis TaxID=47790 RepID=A0A2J8A235_9CHLO|nr:hypothetical protein TSOC_007012 [Tetrabaena socialis]|eukprot:PNH06574.1 hypothetical protein TSOC_007012 [Tetrabaena socialis]